MNAIAQMRRNIGGEVFDYQVLLGALAGYRKPRDRITRLLGTEINKQLFSNHNYLYIYARLPLRSKAYSRRTCI